MVTESIHPAQFYNRWLRWSWFGLTLGVGLAGFGLFILNLTSSVPVSWGVPGGARNHLNNIFDAFQQALLSPLTMSIFGTLILRRHPRHRIGALLVVLGFVTALGQLAQEWAVYTHFTQPVARFSGEWAAWATNWIWLIIFGGLYPFAAYALR